MAQLAIKGHSSRGNEVIEILEMLGGINYHNHSADNDSFCFYIDKSSNVIYYDWVNNCYNDEDVFVFTLEEFLERFPYKVGDKVHHIIDNENQIITNLIWDEDEDEVLYKITNNFGYVYVNYLQPHKEETMEENTDTALAPDLKGEDYSGRRFGYKIPKGYEFECVRNNEIILKPIKPQYPKTYEECAKILLERASVRNDIGYQGDLIVTLQKLLVCRDAYWKIAGWNPQIKGEVFYIHSLPSYLRDLFPMPTAEIRDSFYENFKDLIEACKELL